MSQYVYKTLHRLLKIHYCCQNKKKTVETKSIFILTTKVSTRILKKIFNRLLLTFDPFIILQFKKNSKYIFSNENPLICGFLYIFFNFIVNAMLILTSNQYYHKISEKSILWDRIIMLTLNYIYIMNIYIMFQKYKFTS